jgi:hypothetical protein
MQDDGEGGYVITRDFVLAMMDEFKAQRLIHKRFAFQILLQAREVLRALPSLVDVDVPEDGRITVCGDVHGQVRWVFGFWSLLWRGGDSLLHLCDYQTRNAPPNQQQTKPKTNSTTTCSTSSSSTACRRPTTPTSSTATSSTAAASASRSSSRCSHGRSWTPHACT